MTLPVALTGHDVIGQAKTGTGKTLGFGLPLIERVVVKADVAAGRATAEQLTESPQALIVVPTRELCTQVTNDLQTAGKVRNVRVLAVYGGRAYEPQVEALKKGVDIVVGTPGRLLDLAGQRKLDLSQVRALVLDEADEMLDLGFLPDVEKIITMLPAKRQTLLFSATMPGQVISLARRYMSQPTHIRAAAPDDTGTTVANIEQHIFRAHSLDKVEMVSRILQADGRGLAMIFCRTKRTAADVADQLTKRGFAAGAVHGDLGQGAREQALRAFRNGKVDVLVCTDVAARGIDVEGVTHVINYQCTDDEKTYLHRIGRTGRAGASGTAVTLVDWDDIPRWQLINKALDLPFNDPEETYSTSPHLYELLRIAPGTKGILPRSERTRAGLAAEEVEDLGETGGRGQRPGRSGGRGGRGAAAPETPAPAERPARRNRERRRTRGGSSVATGTATPALPTTEQPAAAPAAPGEGRSSRRRNRNRRNAAAAAPAVVETSVVETAPAPVIDTAPAVVEPVADEAPAARTPRKRTRKAAAPVVEVAVETVPAEPVADEAPAARTPRKRTRKAAAPAVETVAEIVVETAAPAVVEPVTEAPRKRTRKAAAAPAVEVAVEAVETAEAPAPRKRTAKKAAAAIEVVAEEAAPAPRKRATKKAAAAEVVADEAAPAPRKRATKKAAAAEVVAEEAAPAPRKRATKKAVAAVVETPAEEIPAPRKRATKKAAAAAEVVADEAAPAPRKRATKKAAAAEVVAEEAAPAPRKRATKKAAAAEVVADEAAPAPRKRATKKAAAEEIPAPRRTRKTVEQ
ncbi:DEAD/DEAH box helicase [Kitasatospora sp. NPDC092948]|uniref:DEAD/DEAH box helicase n=1 Tax=Kitasatospora sp. NPDC092948 TaxID=3364088 RepID=UPI003810C201